VTIAQAKASLALSITKNVVDRVIRAYQDIINIR
jgi:flagellar hook-basal body complex protein FliE